MSTKTEIEPADKVQSNPQTSEFAQQAEEAPMGLFAEFWDFLIHNKKWWLTPIIIVILLFGALTVLTTSVAAPFLYPFF